MNTATDAIFRHLWDREREIFNWLKRKRIAHEYSGAPLLARWLACQNIVEMRDHATREAGATP